MQGLRLQFDQDNIKKIKEQFNSLLDDLQKQSNSKPITINLNEINKSIAALQQNMNALITQLNSKPLKIFDVEDIRKNNIEVYKSIDEVVKKYEQFGKVTIPNKTLDPITEDLLKFSLNVEKADGSIEKLKFDLVNIAQGADLTKAFTLQGLNEVDNTTNIREKALQQEQSIRVKLEQQEEKEIQNNDKLIEQENNKLKVIELQWQQKIKEIQASAQELNDEELNNKINTFQNNVSSKVSSGAIGQQELKNEYQDIIDYQNKVITNSKETKKSIEDTFKTYISEQDRIKSLGELKGTFDPSLFSKSNEEIKKYAQSLYGLDAKVVGFKKTVDGAGNAVIKMTVNTKNSKNEIQQETLVLDQNTNAVYKNGESIKSNTARMVGYLDRLKNALVKLLPSNMVTY